MNTHLLKRLDLKGYKSIKDASIELRPLNVLIGANGSGKSNLVSFFNMLNHMMLGNLQGFIGTSGGANSLLHYGASTTPQIEASLEFQGAGSSDEYHMLLGHAPVDILVFEDERFSYHKHGLPGPLFVEPLGAGHRESELANLEGTMGRAEKLKDKSYFAVELSFWRSLNAGRVFQFHDTSSTARMRQNGDIDQNHFLMSDGGNLAAFLNMLQKTQPDSYDRIVKTIRLIAPFFGGFELKPLELNPRYIQLRWRERDHDYDFGPHQLSDGTLRAMALVTLLMQPDKDLPRLIIVDEPELGLHPYAITILASLLKVASHHSQIIIATESPALLSHFNPADVVVTERCRGETTFRRCEEAELKEWLEEYTLGELWEKNVLGGRPSR